MSSNRTVNKTYGTVSAERKGEMTGLEFVQGLARRSVTAKYHGKNLGL